MKHQVISADSHIDLQWLPADLFVSNAPAKLKDRVPCVVETEAGQQWMVEGRPLGFVVGGGLSTDPGYVPGESTRLDRMEEAVGFWSDAEKGLLHPTTPDLRRKDQELDGIDAEIIYGLLAIAGAPEAPDYGIHDSEVLRVVYEIYNEWLADFCSSAPRRFGGLASLSNHDPPLAASQLRRAAKRGLRGAEIAAATAVQPLYHEDWDALWATAAECAMPLSFHTLGLASRFPDESDAARYHWVSMAVSLSLFQLAGAEALSSILLSGACERHPDFKFVLGECGIGWIPYVLHRLDDEFDRLGELKLSMKPSEYWLRQGHSTFQIEPVTPDIVERVGEDNILWGSDYPHMDGVFPDSQQVIQEHMGQLSERVRHKIICGNAARLYGFE